MRRMFCVPWMFESIMLKLIDSAVAPHHRTLEFLVQSEDPYDYVVYCEHAPMPLWDLLHRALEWEVGYPDA